MSIRRTFLDTGVVLAAWDAKKDLHEQAKKVLSDLDREFFATSLVALELIPHAAYGKRAKEVAFMRTYLDEYVSKMLEVNEDLVTDGIEVAGKIDAAGIDAMHLAAAVRLNVHDFITLEKPERPMHREKRIRVVYLGDLQSGELA